MMFEEMDLIPRVSRRQTSHQFLNRLVQGPADCWVVVAREERDLEDWLQSEEQAVEVAPLRICTAVLDNGDLILDEIIESDPSELSDWPEPT